MSHLIISKKNEVYLQVKAEPHVYYELADQFTFEVPGAFMPQYRNKYWDGKFVYLIPRLVRYMLGYWINSQSFVTTTNIPMSL
jgi:hypothetical protein